MSTTEAFTNPTKQIPRPPCTQEEYESLLQQNQQLSLRLRDTELALRTLQQQQQQQQQQPKSQPSLSSQSKNGEREFQQEPRNNRVDGERIPPSFVSDLSADAVTRYSRQLLLSDGFGVEGQKKLLSSSVLVVGAGGLASTLLLYLAAAGVSHLTVIDPDAVELSNLHRQIIHSSPPSPSSSSSPPPPPLPKAISAIRAIQSLNPTIQTTPIIETLSWSNALRHVSSHDIVVDASDNPLTRYTLNDACVLANIPLVSGSAMGTEGQLSIYNYRNGGCYRCMYPVSPSACRRPDGCKSCSDNGVLGTVPGLIGVMQATEVIKVLTGVGESMEGFLVMYDAMTCRFVRVRKSGRRKSCVVCGEPDEEERRIRSMEESRDSLVGLRGPAPSPLPLPQQPSSLQIPNTAPVPIPTQTTPISVGTVVTNVSCRDYDQIRKSGVRHVLIDVRPPNQFQMCSLPGAINVPLGQLREDAGTNEDQVQDGDDDDDDDDETTGRKRVFQLSHRGTDPIYCICRRGIASLAATEIMKGWWSDLPLVYNVTGGLTSWTKEVDPSFPSY